MKIQYIGKQFRANSLAIIEQANTIIADFQSQGYDLTLRQLYYQFVAKALIPNTERSYKRLGSIVNDARMAGLIDWDSITDRTRNLKGINTWKSPAEMLHYRINSYCIDKWSDQAYRPEVWIEKDALVGVIQNVCDRNQVDYFSCRGYVSQSEMWSASQRHAKYADTGQTMLIIHLGDHDPSGIDMTRDINSRIDLFTSGNDNIELSRIALNMDQVDEYSPPPNPAKITDPRADEYIRKFGNESWELDALEPKTLENLISDIITQHRDADKWQESVDAEESDRDRMRHLADEL